jgi:hypothetical protein
MVITAVAKNARLATDSLAQERNAVWRGLVQRYGEW